MRMNGQVYLLAALLVAPVSFAMEGDALQTLPSLETVLKGVAEQAQKEGETERAFKQGYSYTRNKLTEYRDAKGELKKREEKKRAYNPKLARAASTAQTSEVKPQKENSSANKKNSSREKAFEKSDFAMTDDLLKRFDFTIVRRESVQGRQTLVLDFKPADKDLPERNIKDKFINRAAGRVWVDEQDYALVKADLHLTERVNVIGGLVGAVWKFTYNFARERTAEGLWFARAVNWHLEGRELFSQRTIDYREENTDVKKIW